MDDKFWYRFRFFFFGVLLGSVGIYFFYWKGDKHDMYKWPSEIIKEKMAQNPIIYTQHGACRMKCRQIDSLEVKEILAKGEVNYGKSQVHDKPCPSYAMEGKTQDGQQVRVICALCDSLNKIVTVIDLNKEKDEELCDCK